MADASLCTMTLWRLFKLYLCHETRMWYISSGCHLHDHPCSLVCQALLTATDSQYKFTDPEGIDSFVGMVTFLDSARLQLTGLNENLTGYRALKSNKYRQSNLAIKYYFIYWFIKNFTLWKTFLWANSSIGWASSSIWCTVHFQTGRIVQLILCDAQPTELYVKDVSTYLEMNCS